MEKKDFIIYIQDVGDMSVGIQPLMVMESKLDQNFVEQLKDDDKVTEFKTRLTQLVCEYFEPDVYFDTFDTEDIEKEAESERIADEAYQTGRNL